LATSPEKTASEAIAGAVATEAPSWSGLVMIAAAAAVPASATNSAPDRDDE
jgi:hypothetical protein